MQAVTTQKSPAVIACAAGAPDLKVKPTSLVSVSTLVIWVFCLAVGVAGLLVPYGKPQARQPEPPPVVAEVLNVRLTPEPLQPPSSRVPASDLSKPPPLQPVVIPLTPPPLAAVAEPSPAVAFALPVGGPTRIVEAAQATPVNREETTAPVDTPPVQAITYGQGEGRQPAPEYPRRAVREGQEGVVRIRFSVGEDGRVLSAIVGSPSPWPLLNNAALRVVRERWRFREGQPRLYEVAIRFELTK